MITVSQISSGRTYLSKHLSANDYYSEGEKVTGHWVGRGAEMLGLEGEVSESAFEALRQNRNPATGEKLTARKGKVAFHDITLSAPKSVSIAAVVGGDERLVAAFRETVSETIKEMEKLAAVRVRTGHHVHSEATRLTGNFVGGVFHHDSSRSLDPQLHAHTVLANATYDAERGRWFALQPVHMLEESNTRLRSFFYRDLAKRVEALGYEIEWKGYGFRLKAIPGSLELTFSQRTLQRQRFEERYRAVFKKASDKRRVEQFIKEDRRQAEARFRREFQEMYGRAPGPELVGRFVKDWRDPKLRRISTQEVRRIQLGRMTDLEKTILGQAVSSARHQVAERVATTEVIQPNLQNNSAESLKAVRATERIIPSARRSAMRLGGVAARLLGQMTATRRKREDPGLKRARMTRAEVLRRLRHGRNVAQAMRGLPRGFASAAVRSQMANARSVR